MKFPARARDDARHWIAAVDAVRRDELDYRRYAAAFGRTAAANHLVVDTALAAEAAARVGRDCDET